jgi:hypothetical protein
MKSLLNIILLCICINVNAQQDSNTQYYYYFDDTKTINGKNQPNMCDEVIVMTFSEDATKCYFYGTSDEFMDSREGFLPGFITLEATNVMMENGRISLTFNSTNHNFYSQPIELFLHTDKDIKSAGYRLWLQAAINCWMKIDMEGTYDNSTLLLTNKTIAPNKTKVFRKVSKDFVTSTYKRTLITKEDESANNKDSMFLE